MDGNWLKLLLGAGVITGIYVAVKGVPSSKGSAPAKAAGMNGVGSKNKKKTSKKKTVSKKKTIHKKKRSKGLRGVATVTV